MRRERLNDKEHVAMGRLLKRTYRDLRNASLAIEDGHGLKLASKFDDVARKIDHLRWLMERELDKDHSLHARLEGVYISDVYMGDDNGPTYSYEGNGVGRYRADLVEGGSKRADPPRKRMGDAA